MTTADLPAVAALAAVVHVNYPEGDEIFAERLRLAPAGCLVAMRKGEFAAYVLSHQWTSLSPPPLDTLLGALPDPAGCWYIHDLAVSPAHRTAGLGSAVVGILKEQASLAGLPCVELTAIPGSEPFWERHGFRALPQRPATLESYGAGATLMRCGIRAPA